MSMLPPNTTALAMNAPPNAPSDQIDTALQQQEVRGRTYGQIEANQYTAGVDERGRALEAAANTNQAAADANLAYAAAELKFKAGLTGGLTAAQELANHYAPQGGDIASLVRQGLRL